VITRRCRLVLRLAALSAVLVVMCSGAVFIATFELMGPPVRNEIFGWLGPTPRRTACISDIGKVNYWRCSDASIFERHRLGCRLWLWLNGLPANQPLQPTSGAASDSRSSQQ
jgi:hypothetical protein